MAKIAKETARVGGFRTMVVKGNSYDDDDPMVKAVPSLFETPADAQKRQHRPQSTAELGDRSMSSRKVEKATHAPGEKRDVSKTCKGTTAAGDPCSNVAGDDGFCRHHGDD